MAKLDRDRLRKLETLMGVELPAEFVAILEQREPVDEGDVVFATPERVWDLRTTYSVDEARGEYEQLDRLYDRVGKTLPPGALPFASDWGDNFYCLMLSGPARGTVVYWDHERDLGDNRVEPVCRSVSEFFDGLAPEPPDAG